MEFTELYLQAKKATNPRKLSKTAQCGTVGAALLTDTGNVYVGICIDTACSMGFCAEHAAVASMLLAGENHIKKLIAVNHQGDILSPCGHCREFLSQISENNLDTEVMVGDNKVVLLKELLPYDWRNL